jgi:hypothetical protein
MSLAEALFGVPVSILDPVVYELDDLAKSTDLVVEESNDLVVEESNDLVVEESNDLAVEESNDLVVEESNDLVVYEPVIDKDQGKVTVEDFQKLSLKDLKEFAKVLSVPTSGNKSTLVTRITTSALPLGVQELQEPFTWLTSWFKK